MLFLCAYFQIFEYFDMENNLEIIPEEILLSSPEPPFEVILPDDDSPANIDGRFHKKGYPPNIQHLLETTPPPTAVEIPRYRMI